MISKNVNLSKLSLDKKNPRFLLSQTASTEEEIYKYFKDYENLNYLVQQIKNVGFNELGERIVVLEEDDKIVVIEGNRRVCALKYLHGFYNEKPSNKIDSNLLKNTKSISADFVKSREEADIYLSIRHITGLEMWKPEQKRQFYGIHYINEEPLEEIKKMSPERDSDIKKSIKEYIFLQEIKKLCKKDIEQPSFIYERLLSYFIKLEVVDNFEIKNKYDKSLNIYLDTHTEDIEKTKSFISDNINIYLKKDKNDIILDSRTAGKFDDYVKLVTSAKFQANHKDTYEIYTKITDSLAAQQEVPKQLISSIFFKENKSVDNCFKIPSKNYSFELFNEKEEKVAIEDFTSKLPVGLYKVRLNNYNFNFKVLPLQKPQIIIFEEEIKNIRIGNTLYMPELFKIIDSQDKIVYDFSTTDFTFSGGISNTEKNILVSSDAEQSISIKYTDKIDTSLVVTTSFSFFPLAKKFDYTQKDDKSYFEFHFVDYSATGNIVVSQELMKELEIAYNKGYLYIFASALRSELECLIFEFGQEMRKRTTPSVFTTIPKYAFEDFLTLFAKLINKEQITTTSNTNFEKVLRDFVKDNGLSYNDLKNYLELNIGGDRIERQLRATLHLGAHKSLTNINDESLKYIRPVITALIELINIIRISKTDIV